MGQIELLGRSMATGECVGSVLLYHMTEKGGMVDMEVRSALRAVMVEWSC